MGRTLNEKEVKQINLFHHHNNGGGRSEVDDVADHYGGEMLYDGDNCVSTYDKDQPEMNFGGTMWGEGGQEEDKQSGKQRLLVVANRLPVSATKMQNNEWKLEISVGGLVSALLGLKDFEAKWIGWAGVDVPDKAVQESLTKAMAEKKCVPVFLDKETVNQYYNGYCNKILWPLLHYLGLPQDETYTSESHYDVYKRANLLFAEAVTKHYKEGDIVWCHDYHLMLLPQYLKQYNSKLKVGWFLHTPFPSSEIQRTLPTRSELLKSVLAADIIGFHTYDYARHFVSACNRILGLEGTPEGVEDRGKLTKVATFPIGIDANRFIRTLTLPKVQEYLTNLRERFAGRKIILGVDCLDMIKGIPQKILAFEKFLEDNPDWSDKVVLLQIAVPTRTDVPEYQSLRRHVHEIVGRVNGRFGTLSSVPIIYLDRSLDFQALCALYSITDIALVTSLRDGMNLVSYESKQVVLILSEFAGAAQSLGAGAILVNPWNITDVSSAIAYALNMPCEERKLRHKLNFEHVTIHTAQEWAKMFIRELNETVVEAQLRTTQSWTQPLLPVNDAIEQFVQSDNQLLVLGFNATLSSVECPFKDGKVIDLGSTLNPNLQEPLRRICNDCQTTVIVISGSKRDVLDKVFDGYNVWLAAENGIYLRHTSGDWTTTMPEFSGMEWVDSIKHVFEYFTKRTPHSFIEERETSLLWNYKYADSKFARLQAKDLLLHLWTGPVCSSSVDVYQGAQSVDVRAVGLTKGAAIDRILTEIAYSIVMDKPINYVLCIGHFLGKDEDLYSFFEPEPSVQPLRLSKSKAAVAGNGLKSSVKSDSAGTHCRIATCSTVESVVTYESTTVLDIKRENYFPCTVGRKHSRARYVLESSKDVVLLLEGLAEVLPSLCA
ncbi:alpha,alpha-trehalose-phosphate synthase [UDP-forming] 1-like isoform X1 [Chenopodium quinoa]|uniref:alpha,alpha-trehalose-phosphate synthase [UDP-forming] 1-like isoform X1 n=1 Tax=Chenopodium quinoa TaxID=63459 RepID=UPI000B77F522|nr:alpha,alpha-trehalose-phosphate synthase [UDP-forming] 1-like isoform X1 [Chenopodium quinoa]